MKHLFQLSILAFLFIHACKSDRSSDTPQSPSQTEASMEVAHTAIKARDHIGLYQGILPCADCEGIETSLYLMANNAYLLTKVYKGKADNKAYKNIGDFAWSEDGTTVSLSNIEDAPHQFVVEDTRAIQLDTEGIRIEGDLAEKYILIKQ